MADNKFESLDKILKSAGFDVEETDMSDPLIEDGGTAIDDALEALDDIFGAKEF